MIQRIYRTFKSNHGCIPVTVSNIKSGDRMLDRSSHDFFVLPEANDVDIRSDIKDWAAKRWNVDVKTVTFDIELLHEYFRAVKGESGKFSGTEAIWLTDSERMANDIPYLFDDFNDAYALIVEQRGEK